MERNARLHVILITIFGLSLSACSIAGEIKGRRSLNPGACLVEEENAPYTTELDDYVVRANRLLYNSSFFEGNVYFNGSGLFNIYNGVNTNYLTTSVDSHFITAAGTVLVGDDVGTSGNIKRMALNQTSFTTVHTVTGASNYRYFREFFQANDGTIFGAFVDRYAANHISSKIFTSTDDGLTWTEVGSFLGTAPNVIFITTFAENSEGVWAIASSSNWATFFDRTHIFYKWNGTTWTQAGSFYPVYSVPGGYDVGYGADLTNNLGQSPVIVHDDEFYMARLVHTGIIIYKVSSDGTTGQVVGSIPNPANKYFTASNIVMDSSGTIFLVAMETDETNYDYSAAKIYSSSDGGATFKIAAQPTLSNPVRMFADYMPTLNFDSDGNLHVFLEMTDVNYTESAITYLKFACE